jgi:PII-like signaling protein
VSGGAALKLTALFGESDRIGRALLSDVLLDRFERHGVVAAALLRAVTGFGIRQRLHSDRVLTLSEDLPLMAIAIASEDRMRALAGEVRELVEGGTVTLERAELLGPAPADARDTSATMCDTSVTNVAVVTLSHQPARETFHVKHPNLTSRLDSELASKMTVYCGRAERAHDTAADGARGGGPAYLEAVSELRRCGAAGATVLLGLDGVLHGERRRARFFSRNRDVPLLIVSVGAPEALRAASARLRQLLPEAVMTIERVRVCKRDGERIAAPQAIPDTDDHGDPLFGRLTLYTGEQARSAGHALYVELVRQLRLGGAAGTTVVRGITGFAHEGPLHGDRLFSLRRHVPVVITLIDEPLQLQRSFEILDRLTCETGLVTSEVVPAFHATAPGVEHGSLRLARPRRP